MGKFNFFEKLRKLIASISFNIFLWAIKLSEDEYFTSIYEQEQTLHQALKEERYVDRRKTSGKIFQRFW